MPDYGKYRLEKNITNADMIAVLKKRFPKYQKSTMTMVNNPYDYAVQLIPEAEAILVEAYGSGAGLSIFKKRSSHSNKNKPNRLYVRLDDALMAKVKAVMERMSFATTQDFVEAAIQQMVEKYGGAA